MAISEVGLRRTWPQRILLFFGLLLAALVLYVSFRLAQFEESVGSIVRIDVGQGVLADLPGISGALNNGADQFQQLNRVPAGDSYFLDPATGSVEKVDQDTDGSSAVPGGQVEQFDSQPVYGPAGPPRTVLLIGTDSAVGLDPEDPAAQRDMTTGIALADVVMLVRIDPGLRRIALVSVPRDLYLPIYREGVPVRDEKLASSLIVGGVGRGAPTLVETVSKNFDVPIHDFVVVDFAGFVDVVDELDGIPMWFDQPVRDLASGLSILHTGCHVLDGTSALAYVRSRRLEVFVGGRWRRVGVSNDLERNQRQQDFIMLALERIIDRGARSVLVRNDLIEAGTEAVVLDDRLSLGDLLDLGRAFRDFDPNDLERYVLPVVDDSVGDLMVLRLRDGDDTEAILDVFRGVELRPENVSVLLVDGRSSMRVDAEAVSIADQLAIRGFLVEDFDGLEAEETVIRLAPHRFDAGVLLAQNLSWTPRIEILEELGDSIELVVGEDFRGLLLAPRDRLLVEAEARLQLPGVLLEDGEALSGGAGWWSFPQIDVEIDGRPPEGVSCP